MRTYILNATGTDISPATIIICVAIAAICIFAVISYRKKLKNGCCGGGGDEVKHVKYKMPQAILEYIDPKWVVRYKVITNTREQEDRKEHRLNFFRW